MREMSCEVISDLLPLYEDGCCSEESKQLVEEHLKVCERCRKQCLQFQMELPVECEKNEPEEAVIRKWSGRWKRRQRVLILFVVLCAALLLFKPIYNEKQGMGWGFSNAHEIRKVKQFCREIEQGDYETAYEMLDMEGHYNFLVEMSEISDDPGDRIAQKGFAWYDAACKDAFINGMKELEKNGYGLQKYQFASAYELPENGADSWYIQMKLKLRDGRVLYADFSVTEGSLQPVSGIQGDAEQKVKKVWMFTYNDAVMETMYEGRDIDWKNIKY